MAKRAPELNGDFDGYKANSLDAARVLFHTATSLEVLYSGARDLLTSQELSLAIDKLEQTLILCLNDGDDRRDIRAAIQAAAAERGGAYGVRWGGE